MVQTKTNNEVTEFFGAITKNCKTIFLETSKKEVRNKILLRGINKNNIAIFKIRKNGKLDCEKKLINRPKFKLTNHHYESLNNRISFFLTV